MKVFTVDNKVKVLFFSWLKDLLGCSEITLTIERSCSFKELLNYLVKALPKAGEYLIDPNGNFRGQFLVFINDTLVPPKNIHSLKIPPKVKVAIAPPASGG